MLLLVAIAAATVMEAAFAVIDSTARRCLSSKHNNQPIKMGAKKEGIVQFFICQLIN